MNLRALLPNFVTAANAFFGMLGILAVFQNRFEWALLLFVLGVICDFLDGFLARLLGVTSPLGVQLDSLADLVTSGILPGALVYQLARTQSDAYWDLTSLFLSDGGVFTLSQSGLIGLLLTLGAAYRLARFNISTDQTHYFKGLATPANALFFLGYPALLSAPVLAPLHTLLSHTYTVAFFVLFFVFLMNSPLRMFKIKWESKSDKIYTSLLVVGAILLFISLGSAAFSLSVVWYLLLCLIRNVFL